MSVKPIIEKLEDAPEAYRPAYVEDSELGRFVIDPVKYSDIATQGLRAKRDRLVASEAELKTKLARFDRFNDLEDNDLDELLSLREQKAQGKLNGDDAAAKYQEQLRAEREKLTNAHKAELAKRDEAVKEVTAKFMNRVRHAELLKLAGEHGVRPYMAAHMAQLVANRFRVVDVEKGTLEFLDEDGEAVSVHSPADAFKTIFREGGYEGFYEASDKGGSGAPTGGTSGGLGRAVRLSREQAKDPATYRAAKERAEKAGVPLEVN